VPFVGEQSGAGVKTIITGGAGFIGTNAAARCLGRGDAVVIIDDLSRPGAEANLEWLRTLGRYEFLKLDMRDRHGVAGAIRRHADAARVLHLAAQVAVTTSMREPLADFEVNGLGSVHLLEALRASAPEAALLYASTNKVYGGLEHRRVAVDGDRYRYTDGPCGVSEDEPLDFHSPYGCSKGSADQYVRDYQRIYGLRTVVFRQSCIYGRRQFGVEDQGWVAWFAIAAQTGRPIAIYGDGRQVRDILFVDDLLDAFDAAFERIDRVRGRVFNVGGGPDNAISVLQLLRHLEARRGSPLRVSFHDWRPGDQRIFVSDIRRCAAELGWTPATHWEAGVSALCGWVAENLQLFA
jgi:CDP-paratose 2-epimerase